MIKPQRLAVPVIVVGNTTVGGTGKTPLLITLVGALQDAGLKPAVISRGYGGHAETWPQHVTADSDPGLVGDEPVLIAKRTGCPVVCAPDRVAAGQALLVEHAVDVLLTDDGLQHYRLARDLEMAVIDGQRGLGNRQLLPAGPMRESLRRLAEVDYRIINGANGSRTADLAADAELTLEPQSLVNVVTGERRPLAELAGFQVDAIAGIGNPRRFYATLQLAGLHTIEHSLGDHQPLTAAILAECRSNNILMTEKDAVKCTQLADERCWYVPVNAVLPAEFLAAWVLRVQALCHEPR